MMNRRFTPRRLLACLAACLLLANLTVLSVILPGDAVSAPRADGHLGPDANAPGVRATFLGGGAS